MRGRSALRLIMARSSLATPKHAVPLGPILDTCFRRRMFQKNTTHRFLLYWVSNSNRQHLLLSILGRQYHNMNTWYPIPICCALAKGHMFLFRIMSQETCLCYSAHIPWPLLRMVSRYLRLWLQNLGIILWPGCML